MPDRKSQNFLRGAATLAAAVAVVKAVGALFKVALGNIIGDEGFAHFTVSYNIYSLLLTLSTAGLPIAVSKMISEAEALGRKRQVRRIFSVSLLLFFALGLVGAMAMLMFPRELAAAFNDIEAEKSISALGPSVFFVCLMSAYRGYTQGLSDMKLTSVSQIIEVVVKACAGLIFARLLLKDGLASASAGAIAGVSAGSALACVYSALYVRRAGKGRMRPYAAPDRAEAPGSILRRLVSIAAPVAFGASVLSVINLIDTRLIMGLLRNKVGCSYMETKVLFGVFGKVQTLFNIPSSFILPLAISVIPAISASSARGMEREASRAVQSSMKLATLLGMPAGIGLSVLAGPIMDVLYKGSAQEGAGLLAILGIASYLSCLALITNAILQAYGQERLPVLTVAAGGLCKIAADILLVGNPDIGIYGAAAGTLLCYAVISLLNLLFLKRVLPGARGYKEIFLKPAVCSALMGASAYFGYPVFSGLADKFLAGAGAWTRSALALSVSIAAATAVYAAAVAATKSLAREELLALPGGSKLAKMLEIR